MRSLTKGDEQQMDVDSRERTGRGRPFLSAEERLAIRYELRKSFESRCMVKVTMYHPYEKLYVIGIVDRLEESRFMVDGEWFDLLNASGAEGWETPRLDGSCSIKGQAGKRAGDVIVVHG